MQDKDKQDKHLPSEDPTEEFAKTLTKKEEHKEAAADEVLDEIGREEEAKGAKNIIEVNKYHDAQTKEGLAQEFEEGVTKRKFDRAYWKWLQERWIARGQRLDVPKGWEWGIELNEGEGIAMFLTDPDKRVYYKGMKPSHNIQRDLHHIEGLCTQAENTFDRWERKMQKILRPPTPEIILP